MFFIPLYIEETIKLLFIVAIISIPLAVWKLIDIIIWCYNHIKVIYE